MIYDGVVCPDAQEKKSRHFCLWSLTTYASVGTMNHKRLSLKDLWNNACNVPQIVGLNQLFWRCLGMHEQTYFDKEL